MMPTSRSTRTMRVSRGASCAFPPTMTGFRATDAFPANTAFQISHVQLGLCHLGIVAGSDERAGERSRSGELFRERSVLLAGAVSLRILADDEALARAKLRLDAACAPRPAATARGLAVDGNEIWSARPQRLRLGDAVGKNDRDQCGSGARTAGLEVEIVLALSGGSRQKCCRHRSCRSPLEAERLANATRHCPRSSSSATKWSTR